jgi:hypothetical protein
MTPPAAVHDTPPDPNGVVVGIDVGTSGARAVALGEAGTPFAWAETRMPAPKTNGSEVRQDPEIWWQALWAVLVDLTPRLQGQPVRRLAIDGTSGSVLACDPEGHAKGPAALYNDRGATEAAAQIAGAAPDETAARGATSSLAKWLGYFAPGASYGLRPLHPADWLTGRLIGRFDRMDENNALKLGYDPVARRWPSWLRSLGITGDRLVKVVEPGTPLGPMATRWVVALGWPDIPTVVAGTTDSTAAFLATGCCQPGDGMTSLGTTLVVKLLTPKPAFEAASGVYSHRVGPLWITGGASNSGGGVLQRFFTRDELTTLSASIDPERSSGLDYYPLNEPGERFPVADPELAPRLEPRPADRVTFLHGLLEGMATIEACGYARLQALGETTVSAVHTVGGGADNRVWTALRARALGVPVTPAKQREAAVGTALLARNGPPSHWLNETDATPRATSPTPPTH